jgi:pyruvate ferredoxin oxidoreductase beta subunit
MDKSTNGFDAEIINSSVFDDVVLQSYNRGEADKCLPSYHFFARSIIPPGTAARRDFSHIAPDIPQFYADKCTGCMECVTTCPDTAILAKVIRDSEVDGFVERFTDDFQTREDIKKQLATTTKYNTVPKKKGFEGGKFFIAVDPMKCKGCAECVAICGDKALEMIKKNDEVLKEKKNIFDFYEKLPETPKEYIQEKVLADMMLKGDSLLYKGGAGSCFGCGEATALRMMLAATGYIYGPQSSGIINSTGCSTVYASTYPFNPYMIPWTNSLFENSAAVALGVRAKWDQLGWKDKKLWVVGGDGAMIDIGFQALSRMLMSGMNINTLVLDSQVYSNTGGQTSTSSFMSQDTKMSAVGKAILGKTERRKELGQICIMHPDVLVAQVTTAQINYFYRAIIAANEYEGPAVINVYSACQPEHGIGDDMSQHQAKLAVESRAFPIFIYDPRKGSTIRERLSLQGNPAVNEDWYKNPKTGEVIDFIYFARTEGRFSKLFNKDGTPKEALLKAQDDRLKNWRMLQELAGVLKR